MSHSMAVSRRPPMTIALNAWSQSPKNNPRLEKRKSMKPKPTSSISKRGRTLKVAGLAARVGASYGRFLISRTLGLSDQDSASLVHSKNAARILETAVALRGPFMKVVQMIATQGD